MISNEEVKPLSLNGVEPFSCEKALGGNLPYVIEEKSNQSFIDMTWTEFNDRDYADWKRVRCTIEHENILTSQRLTWLLSSQTVLITGYILTFIQWGKVENTEEIAKIYPVLLLIIISFGIVLSLYIRRIIASGGEQLRKLNRWWYQERNWGRNISEKEIEKLHPPLQGRPRSRFDNLVNAESIPWLFVFAWFAILIFSIIRNVDPMIQHLFANWKDIMLVLVGTLLFTREFSRKLGASGKRSGRL
jgi:hypothetical protein